MTTPWSASESSPSGLRNGTRDAQQQWTIEQRREKSRSSQSASHLYNSTRRGSLKPLVDQRTNVARPGLSPRTYSAPLVERSVAPADDQLRPDDHLQPGQDAFRLGNTPDTGPGALEGPDEDEVAGVVGAVRSFQPFRSSQLAESLPEINIAVIGAGGVGKSTFVQQALSLPDLPPSQAAECKIPIDGSTYLVRLLELPLEEIDVEDDEISWPDTIEDKVMPKVDGALALYDVRDKGSIEDLPEMLNAITKTLPTVLVSCKCDGPLSHRQVDPSEFNFRAKRAIGNIGTLQISRLNPEVHKRGVFSLLRTILDVDGSKNNQSRSSSANRRRAQSTAIRSLSPRHSPGHSRASSEFTGGLLKDRGHARHDSSIAAYSSNDHLRVPGQVSEDSMPHHSSFLLEESPSETSPDSERSSLDTDNQVGSATDAYSSNPSVGEDGATFDDLVDRLLAQPASKADIKFAAVFLALYRKFAAPGRLLEALVERFDMLERERGSQMVKTVNQLRYMSILEQWVSSYPGDFAFPKTKRRLRVFTSKLAETRIFAVAAREISLRLEAVLEDDDTHWAYSDRDRESKIDMSRSSMSSTASTLIDDPSFAAKLDLSGSTLNEDAKTTADIMAHLKQYNQMLADVDAAQRQAELLQAIPRNPITKLQWHALMDYPDDLIARDLTRIDWIMFLSIRPRDLVRHISAQKEQTMPYRNLKHVNRMAEHFNQLAAWVVNYVLLRDKPKHRAMMLEKFMRIARKLRELNNYNALGAIIAGVSSSSICRLAATRELIPPNVGRDWLKLEVLMASSRSHFTYRLAWENSSNERIPYMPLHRRDLVAAEEGNKSFIGDEQDGRINWKKFEIMGDVVVSLQRAQGMPYRNLGGPANMEQMKELLLDVKLVKDEEELYERSLQCEAAAGSSNTATARFKGIFKR